MRQGKAISSWAVLWPQGVGTGQTINCWHKAKKEHGALFNSLLQNSNASLFKAYRSSFVFCNVIFIQTNPKTCSNYEKDLIKVSGMTALLNGECGVERGAEEVQKSYWAVEDCCRPPKFLFLPRYPHSCNITLVSCDTWAIMHFYTVSRALSCWPKIKWHVIHLQYLPPSSRWVI